MNKKVFGFICLALAAVAIVAVSIWGICLSIKRSKEVNVDEVKIDSVYIGDQQLKIVDGVVTITGEELPTIKINYSVSPANANKSVIISCNPANAVTIDSDEATITFKKRERVKIVLTSTNKTHKSATLIVEFEELEEIKEG